MDFTRRTALAGIASALALPAVTHARHVLLTIDGDIGVAAERVELDFAQIEALGTTTFRTASPWTAAQDFTGVPLARVVALADPRGNAVRAEALNRYTARIPLAELEPEAPIIATRIDGQPFGVRENGPLWIVYPYDAAPRYRTDIAMSRSVWQLSRLTVIHV